MWRGIFIVFLVVALAKVTTAQMLMEYTMADTTVTDCDGLLSDTGGPDEVYGNNEDLSFTVNSGGDLIEITFLADICIEEDFDYLYIHDGIDTNAPLIATLTGFDFTPGMLTATSGAVTFNFVSESSAIYCGFEIWWNTIAGPPPVPLITVNELPTCGTNEVLVDFSYPIGCDWLETDSITFVGNTPFDVLNADVICENDSGTQAVLQLAQSIDYNCDYTVSMVIGVPDACDSLWYFMVNTTFQLTTCDIAASVEAEFEELCGGGCTNIQAFAAGCFEHTFEWDNGLPTGPGPHNVCPTVTTTYNVTVTEVPTGNTTIESVTIFVNDAGIVQESGPLCQSELAFFLESSVPGGVWSGPGVQDENTGYFIPDSADAGQNIIYYQISETCYDSVIFDVTAIEAGVAEAVCPGQGPFFLQPETPGGVWSGPFVQPDGLFDPSVPGNYEVFYALDGCSDTLMVNIEEITGQFDLDTLCQSIFADTLDFSPLGGTWSGPGIIDPFYGIFDPAEAPPGDHILMYDVVGCNQEFTIHIKETYTGDRVRTSCPEQTAFIPQPDFAPTGGYWEGVGISDTNSGEYSPGDVPNNYWTELIYYAPNGCTDTIFYYNRQTVIATEQLFFCEGDEFGVLDDETVGRAPWGGEWIGPGLTNPWGNRYEFSPAAAGVGEHTLFYHNNDCVDSIEVFIYPNQINAESYEMCTNAEGFYLDASLPSGGTWSGFGVTDAAAGWFEPSEAIPAEYYVYWENPAGCGDSILVNVEEYFEATLGGLDPIYCFNDVDIPLDLYPEFGTLSGSTAQDSFNPALAGEGPHELLFTWEGNFCSSSQSATVEVYPQLIATLSASDTILCPGAGSTLSIEAGGGQPDIFYEYVWSDGLFPINEVTAIPEESQYFYVSVEDGCSDPFVDSVYLEVLPPIEKMVTTSDTLCFGYEGGFASAEVLSEGDFDISWEGNGEVIDGSFVGTAGTIVELTFLNTNEGCNEDTLVLIPSYTPVSALFSPNPNEDCVGWNNQPIDLIDLSQHGLSGYWDFGNEEIAVYDLGSNPSISYETPGDYSVLLYIENEGGCPDSIRRDICILPPTPIFIPDIFSPNGDQINDELFVRGEGITEMLFRVFDRWGVQVYEGTDPQSGWDGTRNGKKSPSGVYVWYLNARLNDGTIEESSGNVTLIR